MRLTIGFHFVKTSYGLWLPGDQRGHWSEAWDEQIGLIEPRKLHPGDPIRERMAAERMKHPPTRFSAEMIKAVAEAVGRCAAVSDWKVAAAAVEATHMHLLLTFTSRNIDNTVKWIADQTTKAVHARTPFTGPIWCKGRWLQFIYNEEHWENLYGYIERHNLRRGLPAKPYPWIL